MKYHKELIRTDVEWLPEIPNHWQLKRLKDDCLVETGSRNTEDKQNEGEYPFFVRSQTMEFIDTYSFDGEAILTAGDGVGVAKVFHHYIGKFETHQRVYRISKFKNIYGRFLFYYLQENLYKEVLKFNAKSTVDSLRMPMFQRFPVLVPPLHEQTAIAQYLDTKTQAIDKKVNLLEKKIGYYKELRKSIINETVTKGLDKSAVLQENDLGFETPSAWSKKRLKDVGFLYSGLSGKSGDDFNQDDNPNNKGFIPFTNIANNTYLKKDHLGTVVVFEGEKQNKVKEGDIFFLMSSEGYEDIGKSAVLAENIADTYLNSFCKGFRIKQKHCNPYFLNYLLLSDYYRQILIIEGKGFTRINLKMEKINDFEVYLPKNLSEQSDIVTYLDHKTQTINKIIGNIQNQITTLKELRKTLINDVVTGKIKVVE